MNKYHKNHRNKKLRIKLYLMHYFLPKTKTRLVLMSLKFSPLKNKLKKKILRIKKLNHQYKSEKKSKVLWVLKWLK